MGLPNKLRSETSIRLVRFNLTSRWLRILILVSVIGMMQIVLRPTFTRQGQSRRQTLKARAASELDARIIAQREIAVNRTFTTATAYPSVLVSDVIETFRLDMSGIQVSCIPGTQEQKLAFLQLWVHPDPLGSTTLFAYESIASLQRARDAVDVYILTTDQNSCRSTNPLSTGIDDNIHFYCMSPKVVNLLITDGFCDVWKCTGLQFWQVYDTITYRVETQHRFLAAWRPMLGSIFRRILSNDSSAPGYRHWAFGDFDNFYGDLRRLIPWQDVGNTDVTSFATRLEVNGSLWTRGQMTIFSSRDYIQNHWARSRFFCDVETFLNGFEVIRREDATWGPHPKAFDEGENSAELLKDLNVTWKIFTGLQASDLYIEHGSTAFVLRGDRPGIFRVPTSTTEETQKRLPFLASPVFKSYKDFIPARADQVSTNTDNPRLVRLANGSSCSELDWINTEDNVCIAQNDYLELSIPETHLRMYARLASDTDVTVFHFPNPFIHTIDGKVPDAVQDQITEYVFAHNQMSKNEEGMKLRTILKEDEGLFYQRGGANVVYYDL